MAKESKYTATLKELGFKSIAELFGPEGAEREAFWRKVNEDATKGMNRQDRRKWNKLGKVPRFANLHGGTFATDDNEHHWAAIDTIDLKPFGFVDMVADFQARKILASKPSRRFH